MASSGNLARSSILQIGGKLFGTLLGLLSFYFLLQTYDDSGFGVLTTALTYVSVFAIIVDFGLTLTTTQMISEKAANEERILGNLMTLRILSAALFFLLPPLLLPLFPNSERLLPLVLICIASSFFGSVAQVFIGVFQKRLAIGAAVFAETASRVVSFVIVLLSFLLTLPLWFAALGFALGGLVQLVFMLTAVHSRVKLRFRAEWSAWKEILRRSWPIGLSIFFNLLYLKGDILFLWWFGVSDAEIGQYGSAYKVVDVLTIVPVTFMGLALPQLTLLWSENKKEAFLRLARLTLGALLTLGIPIGVGAVLIGRPLMQFVDSDLTLAGNLLRILGPAAAMVYVGSFFGHVIVALGKQRMMTWGYLLVALLTTWAYVTWIPLHQSFGAAWATLLAETTITVLTATTVLSTTRGGIPWTMLLRSIAATAAMASLLILFSSWHVIPLLILGVVVYGVAIIVLGGPSPKQLFNMI